MMEFLKRINDYTLFVLIFSITFENWDVFGFGGTLSVTFIMSIAYIVTWVPFFKSSLNLFIFQKYTSFLLLFIVIGFVSTSLNPIYLIEFKQAFNYRVLLLILLMHLIANHLFNSPDLIFKTLNVFMLSIVLLFILSLLGIGVTYAQGRLEIFGENPNMIGFKGVLSFMIVIGRIFTQPLKLKIFTKWELLVIPASISLVLASGSRGAFLSLFVGFTLAILFKEMNIFKKLVLVAIGGFVATTLFIYALTENKVLQTRLQRSLDSGDIGRNELWEGAILIIKDNLFFGVGFTDLLPNMFKYSGYYLDPHNVFLYVLVTTGIIGFLFYMTFIVKVGIGLYRTYFKTKNISFLLLFCIVLFNMFKVGGGIGMIIFWLFFAIFISHISINKNAFLTTS
ncbi:O-antigen ligase family protein [Maribacter litoralis]|uniref:O-antigen ligase family protein n=1 Tax=Maribacter litoralis TaxID=2059726 RepID=UPI003D28EFC5